MDVDSLSGIMEFSNVKERRNLSCVSSLFKDTFESSKIKRANSTVKENVRKRLWKTYWYALDDPDELINDVFPSGFNRHQFSKYIDYQIDGIFQRSYVEGMSCGDFCDIVRGSFHIDRIFKIGTVLSRIEDLSHEEYMKMTIDDFFLRDIKKGCECFAENISELEIPKDLPFFMDIAVDSGCKTFQTRFMMYTWEKKGLSLGTRFD